MNTCGGDGVGDGSRRGEPGPGSTKKPCVSGDGVTVGRRGALGGGRTNAGGEGEAGARGGGGFAPGSTKKFCVRGRGDVEGRGLLDGDAGASPGSTRMGGGFGAAGVEDASGKTAGGAGGAAAGGRINERGGRPAYRRICALVTGGGIAPLANGRGTR